MPATSGEIIETGDEVLPFKVVFSKDGRTIAEHSVATYAGARRLIEELLPLFQKQEDD